MQKAKFIISRNRVLEQYDKIRKECDLVSYSSKTNPLINSILEEKTDSLFSIHMISELENKNSEYFQTLVEEGIRFMEELAVLHDISNDTGWQGIGNIRINPETKMKYFDPDTANLSRLIGEDIIPELILKVKQYLNK